MTSASSLGLYPLFANQSELMLSHIATIAEEKKVEAGFPLFFEGEIAKRLYIVLEGSVVLTMNMAEKTEDMEALGTGEVIGWSSIVKPHLYKLGAYARRESRLLIFSGEKLQKLLDENPAHGYYFMQNLAEVIGDRLISKCVQVMSLAK